MFKEFKKIFEKRNLMDVAIDRTMEMLSSVQEMYDLSVRTLRQNEKLVTREEIGKRDKVINRFEREVRQNVYIHLVMTDKNESYTPLVLLNIVIDVERIGDYTKNIMELAVEFDGILPGKKFEDDMQRMEKSTGTMLARVYEAFDKSDDAAALKVIEDNSWITRRCDEIVQELVGPGNKSDFTPQEAAAVALYFRYLKRICAHCLNIATTLVNPFDSIGFRPNR